MQCALIRVAAWRPRVTDSNRLFLHCSLQLLNWNDFCCLRRTCPSTTLGNVKSKFGRMCASFVYCARCSCSYLRLWDRQSQPERLFHAPLCPADTDIAVERDLTTGDLLGYHEVACLGVCLWAWLTCSLYIPAGGVGGCGADRLELYLPPEGPWTSRTVYQRRFN